MFKGLHRLKRYSLKHYCRLTLNEWASIRWTVPGSYMQFHTIHVNGSFVYVLYTYVWLTLETISRHIKDTKVIKSSQHGFTKELSCLTTLITSLDERTGLVDKGRAVVIVSLDSRRVFNTVSCKSLTDKQLTWVDSEVDWEAAEWTGPEGDQKQKV